MACVRFIYANCVSQGAGHTNFYHTIHCRLKCTKRLECIAHTVFIEINSHKSVMHIKLLLYGNQQLHLLTFRYFLNPEFTKLIRTQTCMRVF